MEYSKNFYQIKSNKEIFEAIKKERESIGYYSLPFQDTEDIKAFASNVKQKHIAVIGIGGSSLGSFAIYDFLRRSRDFQKTLHFFETTDPIDIYDQVRNINLQDTLFIVISKSGTTVETISTFKYLHSLVTISKENCVIISESDSKLTHYAKQHDMTTFDIPKNVGGRFSVFSAVGLVPLACIGVDIDALLRGCADVSQSFFDEGEDYALLMEKGRFIVENKHRFNINVLFSYSSTLNGFNKWYVQLWGESLGKLNVNNTRQAFTPIGLIGPVDQHSFLQLIAEGKRDKTITFIKVEDSAMDIAIPEVTLEGLEELDYLNNLTFHELISHQADATIEAIDAMKHIPYDVISIKKVDEFSLARLMFSYQLLTSIVGKFVNIDTYNQPGVEAGKIILKKKLQTK